MVWRWRSQLSATCEAGRPISAANCVLRRSRLASTDVFGVLKDETLLENLPDSLQKIALFEIAALCAHTCSHLLLQPRLMESTADFNIGILTPAPAVKQSSVHPAKLPLKDIG